MAYTTVNKSSDYFNCQIWTGTGASQNITGNNFLPSFAWIKALGSGNHHLFDQVRGVQKYISSNLTNAEATSASMLTAFNSDGYTLGGDGGTNGNGYDYVGWNWKANGQGSSNTDGTINTIYTSASATSGFSICQYTGTGANATVGHGLGVAPKVVMVKQTNTTKDWMVYHKYTNPDGTGAQYYLHLNNNDSRSSNATMWQNTDPTSSVFSIGTSSNVNGSGDTYIAYCFADTQGFSNFNYFNGNANVDGPFIYTGFAPAYVLTKRVNGAENWFLYDNARSPINVRDKYITVDGSGANSNTDCYDFLSNGFKLRTSADALNGSHEFIYMAFAAAPLVSTNGDIATAR